jgi:phage shock protein A
MSMWKQLVTMIRGTAYEAGQSVTDARALTILDQQIRDAGAAQAKARDDLAGLTAKRRMIEKDLEALTSQRIKYEASARAAMQRGDMDLARQVAERLASIESEASLKAPQIEEMRTAEDRIRGIIHQGDGKIEALRREVKEQQAIREEKFRASAELEDMRTGADLDAKLRDAGLLPGSSSADDILARLAAPAQGEPLRLPDASRDPLQLPRE